MKPTDRPPHTNHRDGYNQVADDQFGKRDGHGGYVPNKQNITPGDSNADNHAHGQGKQAERTNPRPDGA